MKNWSERIVTWATDTFGISSEAAAYRRFEDECKEFILERDPRKKAEEAADLVITLATYIKRTGFDLADLVDMKMFVNERREWVLNGDGTGQHVKNPELDAESRRLWVTRAGQSTNLEHIKRACAHRFGTTPLEIDGSGRTQSVALARKVYMFLLRDMGLSYPEIGAKTGRDHTTVMSACDSVRQRPELLLTVETIKRELET
jgi:hypothetical protein